MLEVGKKMSELRAYQKERIGNIKEWYCQFYSEPELCHEIFNDYHQNNLVYPLIIRYMILWAVFNALYNVADLPNNRLPNRRSNRYKFQKRRGHLIPNVVVNGDSKRISLMAETLAKDENFLSELTRVYHNHIRSLSGRIPTVRQPENYTEGNIPVTYKDGKDEKNKDIWINEDFSPDGIRGIASLDSRLFLDDNLILYKYATLDNPFGEDRQIQDRELFVEQLLFVLYQIRNNIMHGGAASLGDTKKTLLEPSQPILNFVVRYLFEHEELLLVNESNTDAGD